ncbi:MAG: hypothetical protein ACFHVJ_04805 [Aestuariibacter sp.]
MLNYLNLMRNSLLNLLWSFCFVPLGTAQVLWLDNVHNQDSVKINESTFELLAAHTALTFQRETVNTPRALKIMADGKLLACRGNLKKTQKRNRILAMTAAPQLVFPGVRMYSHIVPEVSEPIDFQSFVNQKEVLIGVINGRHYPDVLGLNERKTAGNVYRLHAYDNSESMIDLFVKRRVNVIIEYPTVFKSYTDDVAATFKSYTLQGVEKYNLGYIACTDSVQGRETIELFDKAIRELSSSEKYLQAQAKWFRDFAFTPLYNEVYKTRF